jgi:NAD(P)-dependent dehydrogenase (short-subunit alcohol dehydrogenase family)
MMPTLDGAVVLCVGGGSGIGRAAALAYHHAGARVAVVDRDESKLAGLAAERPELLTVAGDATARADMDEAVAATTGRWGRLDVLATFVGVFDHYLPLVDIPEEEFDAAFTEIFDINVRSALVAVRATHPALATARGSIVLTLSSSSFYAGRGGALYVASKFALRGVVTQLAHELAPEIRVNGVAPGGTVSTDMRGLRSLGQADNRLDDRPGRPEAIEARTPLQLAMRPEDHAGAYLFLASQAAKAVTGEIIRSDGGVGVR